MIGLYVPEGERDENSEICHKNIHQIFYIINEMNL